MNKSIPFKVQEPRYALEILLKIKENYPEILKNYWGDDIVKDPVKWFEKAQEEAKKLGFFYVSIYLNIDDENEIEYALDMLQKISDISKMPMIVRGTGQKGLDEVLLPQVIPYLNENVILGCVQDTNYKKIVQAGLNRTFIMRTPIDINLTKELNVLSSDLGQDINKILIDPDMGCVGYGLDYGYSIIERIKQAAFAGDKMLDMPIIVFAGEESFKAKEAKSTDFKASWGKLEVRAASWEIATATSLICAGADLVVLWYPKTLETLREVFKC